MFYESDAVEIDIDPDIETDDPDDLVEEFGAENVMLAHYYLHRKRLFKLRILTRDELESDDLVAFLLIDEEQGLYDAQEQAKMKSKADGLR